jgi:hypothetical protein
MPKSRCRLEALHTGCRLHARRVEPRGSWRGRDAVLVVSVGTRSEWHVVKMKCSRNDAQAHECKPVTRWAGSNHYRIDFPIFKIPPNLKYKMKANLMFKNIPTWHGGRVEHSEQLFQVGRLQIPNRIQVTNFGINSDLNIS